MKKVISLVLTACMVLALVPTFAFATEADVQDVNAAQSVETTAAVLENGEAVQGEWRQDPTTLQWQYFVGEQYMIGKIQIGASYYYFDQITGYLTTGWVDTAYDGRNYFNPQGVNPTLPGDTLGVMKTGWLKLNGKKYYLNLKTGKMKTGWLSLDKEKYYFKDNGVMKTGWLKLNGNKYYLNLKNGKMFTGFHKIDGYRYYFNTSNGKMKSNGAVKDNGNLYYFYKSGKAVNKKGWFKGSDGKTRYCCNKKTGQVYTGTKCISGYWYEFSSSTGILLKRLGDNYDRSIRNKTSGTKYLIQVIKSRAECRVYRGSKGNWSRIYTFRCAYGSTSYNGTFRVSGKLSRHDYKDKGNTVHWNYGTNFSNYGFNGYVYDASGKAYDTRLGGKYSRGRIRLADNNALWVYNNIGSGTTVYVH